MVMMNFYMADRNVDVGPEGSRKLKDPTGDIVGIPPFLNQDVEPLYLCGKGPGSLHKSLQVTGHLIWRSQELS